jgi:hypothetical protein
MDNGYVCKNCEKAFMIFAPVCKTDFSVISGRQNTCKNFVPLENCTSCHFGKTDSKYCTYYRESFTDEYCEQWMPKIYL